MVASSPPTNTPARAVVPTASAPGPVGGSPLRRHDAPPDGIDRQLRITPGGGDCDYALLSGREDSFSFPGGVGPRVPEIEIPQTIAWCFFGFTDNQSIQVEVTLPSGDKQSRQSIGYRGGQVVWDALPGDQLGTYRVVAAQGKQRASASFIVKLATSPTLRRFGPIRGQPGTTFRFAFAGFQPNQLIALYLYQADPAIHPPQPCGSQYCYRYLTALESARADQDGKGFYDLHTQTGDPPTHYWVVSTSPGQDISRSPKAVFFVEP